MTPIERKFLTKIVDDPGLAASQLPRPHRGATIKALELAGLIHYGPGGWFPTQAGLDAIGESEPAR
jgi:hypothetical protein